jgi:hypothetical protein
MRRIFSVVLLAILFLNKGLFGVTTAIAEENQRRLVFTEYGKGPNRFVELDASGKLIWEFKPPSTAVIFQVLPNGNLLFGYGGSPTGVREITSRGETVFEYRIGNCFSTHGTISSAWTRER